MSADPFFRMTVEDVFFIKGRGTVVTGQVESGTLRIGDEIYIRRPTSSQRVIVTGIEMFRRIVEQARAGDTIGVLFVDLTKEHVQHGDILLGSDIEFHSGS